MQVAPAGTARYFAATSDAGPLPPAARPLPAGDGVMDKDLAGQVVDIAQRVVASGAISASGHGNVGIRVPAMAFDEQGTAHA